MPVSDWLQSHFDKKRKKQQVAQKLQRLQGQIDPAFLESFEKFRNQVLGIVEETPSSTDMVQGEIQTLETKLQRVNSKRKIQTFETITENI